MELCYYLPLNYKSIYSIMKLNNIRSISFAAICCILITSCFQNKTNKTKVIASKIVSTNSFEKSVPIEKINIGNGQMAIRHRRGQGVPLVFVHGSLDNQSSWFLIVNKLKIKNPIILLDLIGHSNSSLETEKQGSIYQDANDIIQMIKKLGYSTANFIGHSYGANIVTTIAITQPEIANDIILYEPPLFGLLFGKEKYKEQMINSNQIIMKSMDLLQEGNVESGLELFINKIAFGENSWRDQLTNHTKEVMINNYKTLLDQAKDEERLKINVFQLNNFKGDITILQGTESLPHFKACIYELKEIIDIKETITIKGAKHSGIFTHSDEIAIEIKKLF